MPPYEYDWVRTWRPLRVETEAVGDDPAPPAPAEGQALDEIDWDAVFGGEGEETDQAGAEGEAEPQEGEGVGYDHPLAEYDGVGLLVLLGAAGAGKTHELERLEEALLEAGEAHERIRVREAGDGYELAERLLDDAVRGDLGSGRTVYLLVDALDESADPRVLDRLSSRLRRMDEEARQRIRLRVTSRSSYHSASLDLRADLTRIGGLLGSSLALEIQPLSREQVATAAATRGLPDPEGFVARVRERRVLPLAEVPGSLNLLLDLYAEAGDLPATRMGVYDEGLRLRLSSLGRANALAWSPEQFMDGVGAVAALLLLSGKTFVQADAGTRVDPSVGVPLHEVRRLRPLQDLPESELAKFFHSGLFEGAVAGPHLGGLVEIRSREFAEFLAARYIALPSEEGGRPPSEDDLLALLAVEVDPRRGVNPALFSVAGWAAAFNPDALFDHLLDTDADALLLGDPGVLSCDRKRHLVDELVALVSARRVSPYDLRRMGLAGLRHEGVEEQARPLLAEGAARDGLPTILGLGLFAATKAEALAPHVVAITLDAEFPLHVRNVALDALEEASLAPEHLAPLLPLLADDAGDPFFSLRAAAATLLYPGVVSAAELFAAMALPPPDKDEEGVDFSFRFYLTHELPPLLDAAGVEAAFLATWPLVEGKRGGWGIGRAIEAFEDALLQRAVELSGLSAEAGRAAEVAGLADHLLAWTHRNDYSRSGDLSQTWRSSAPLRMFVLALAAQGGSGREFSRLFSDDRDAIADLLPASSGQERAFYTELLWAITQNLQGVPVRLRLLSDDGFKAYAAQRYGLPPDSPAEAVAEKIEETAAEWLRWDEERERSRSEPESGVQGEEAVDPNVVVAEASDWTEVWGRLHRVRLSGFNADWTTFPDWERLSEPNRERALALAEAHLAEGGPGEGWSEHWREARQSGEVNAAHAALGLLCDHDRYPGDARWVATLVALALTSGQSEERWRRYALTAWNSDAALAREAALHTALGSGVGVHTNKESLVAFAGHDPALVEALGEALSTDGMQPETARLAASVMVEAAFDKVSSTIAAVLRKASDPKLVAAVAVPLLQSGHDLPELWERLASDRGAGASVVARLASRHFEHDEDPINVTPEQRRVLLSHAVTAFPPSALPKRPLSGSYTPTGIDDVQAWVGRQASLLVEEGEYEVLEAFVEEHPRYGYLPHRAWVSWRAKRASEAPWSVPDLVAQLNDLNLRRISTPYDLQRVVLESLGRYQRWLDDGAVYDLWSDFRPTLLGLPAREEGKKLPDVVVPRREEPASDHLARFLSLDLPRIIVRREVRTPKRGRTDVEVTVVDREGREVRTIVEVKGSFHSKATDVQSELVDRYLTDNDATGIHLVFDFWTPVWSKLDRTFYGRSKNMTGSALEEALRVAVGSVTESHRVETFVVKAPFPSS